MIDKMLKLIIVREKKVPILRRIQSEITVNVNPLRADAPNSLHFLKDFGEKCKRSSKIKRY